MTAAVQKLSEDLIRKAYRIDFALILLTGNVTRYLITRPLVEQDSEVVSRWYPIRTWYEEDPLGRVPYLSWRYPRYHKGWRNGSRCAPT